MGKTKEEVNCLHADNKVSQLTSVIDINSLESDSVGEKAKSNFLSSGSLDLLISAENFFTFFVEGP